MATIAKRLFQPGSSVLRARPVVAVLPIAAAVVVLALLPPLGLSSSTYATGLAVDALVLACYGVGFNLIFGSTNQLFLCIGALAAIGGYATAILADHESLPIGVGVLVGTVAAALVGGLMSWIAVRRALGVIFTGIVTLVFSLSYGNLLLGVRNLTGGETGQVLTGAAVRLSDQRLGGYWLFAGLLVAFLVVFRALQLSHVGWAFRALRDDETSAELAGVDVARYRVYAAVVGSAMVGLAGGLYAYSDGYISPATYAFDQVDVRVLVLVAFGGLGSVLAPVVGSAVFAVLENELRSSGQIRELLYGVVLMVIFLGLRRGLAQTLADGVRALTERRARRTEPKPVSVTERE